MLIRRTQPRLRVQITQEYKAPGTRWLPRAKDTTYNMVMAVGDVSGRPNETNGGLQNLARLLENWQGLTAA